MPARAPDPAPELPSAAAGPRRRPSVFSRRPARPEVPPAATPARDPEPVAFGALARLEADPALTTAQGAVPRGPEIRIAARLEAGPGSVRDLPTEPVSDVLTEETR